MDRIPILDNEELWAGQVIDDTNLAIRSLLDLVNRCIELKINSKESEELYAELCLHNANHNIELEIDRWLAFCTVLNETVLADKSEFVQIILNTYSVKHLKSKG